MRCAAITVASPLNPVSITFTDTDSFSGSFGGTITVTRPDNDDSIQSYRYVRHSVPVVWLSAVFVDDFGLLHVERNTVFLGSRLLSHCLL